MYSDGVDRTEAEESEASRFIRDFTGRRLDSLILGLQRDKALLLARLERQSKPSRKAQAASR